MKAEFYKKKLKNGLTVLFEKRKFPVVSVSSSVKYGAAYESASKKGISHFVEHLIFKGTKTRNHDEIAKEVEKKGGILNGFTSEELTSYWCKMPSKNINSGLDIVSDLILNPRFDDKDFEKEKKIIVEEIKMYHDNPAYYVPEKIKEMLYKKPFGESIAGGEEIIKNLTRSEARSLFNSVYTTDSMILAVVGDADFADICKKAEKIYPATKRKLIEFKAPRLNKEKIEKRRGLEQAHFVFGFHTPTMQEKKRYAYEAAMAYLADGMSSVLFREIREKRSLAYAVKGNLESGRDYGYAAIYSGTQKEKIKEIKEIILKEFKNLKNLKLKDLNEAKEQLIGNKKVVEEDSTMAMNILLEEEIAGSAFEYYKYEERVNSIKLSDIRNIKLKTYSTFSLVPK